MTLPAGEAPGAAGVSCQCCQKTRTDPDDIAVFGHLVYLDGRTFRVCGKCIQVMWRKRAPRPDKM